MASVDWPSIRQPYPPKCSSKRVKPAYRFESAAGKQISRPKYTTAKWVFTLGWDALTIVDFDVLVSFFDNYQGTVFNWTHYKTKVVYECLFTQDELPEAEYIGVSHVTLKDKLIIREK